MSKPHRAKINKTTDRYWSVKSWAESSVSRCPSFALFQQRIAAECLKLDQKSGFKRDPNATRRRAKAIAREIWNSRVGNAPKRELDETLFAEWKQKFLMLPGP